MNAVINAVIRKLMPEMRAYSGRGGSGQVTSPSVPRQPIEMTASSSTHERFLEGVRVSTWLAGGSLVGCGHYRWLQGCALLTVAALTATGHELLEAQSSTRAYAGAGARGGLEVPLSGRLALTVQGEIVIPFGRVHLVDARSRERLWSTKAVSGGLGLGVLLFFL